MSESDSVSVPKIFITQALQENENVCAQLDEERAEHIQTIQNYQQLELSLRKRLRETEIEYQNTMEDYMRLVNKTGSYNIQARQLNVGYSLVLVGYSVTFLAGYFLAMYFNK